MKVEKKSDSVKKLESILKSIRIISGELIT